MKRISDLLVPHGVIDLVNDVEKDLAAQAASGQKLSKASIIRALAARMFCSPSSTDVWRTLMAAGIKAGYWPETLAKITDVKPVDKVKDAKPVVDSGAEPPLPPPSGLARTGVTTPVQVDRTPKSGLIGLNLRSAATIKFSGRKAEVQFLDGETKSVFGFDASDLQRVSTVVEP